MSLIFNAPSNLADLYYSYNKHIFCIKIDAKSSGQLPAVSPEPTITGETQMLTHQPTQSSMKIFK